MRKRGADTCKKWEFALCIFVGTTKIQKSAIRPMANALKTRGILDLDGSVGADLVQYAKLGRETQKKEEKGSRGKNKANYAGKIGRCAESEKKEVGLDIAKTENRN